MKSREGSTLAALQRAQGFLDANASRFASVNASTARQALDDAVAQLSGHAVNQSGGDRGIRGETARQRALKRALRQLHMQPIATAARIELRGVPEFAALTAPFGHFKLDRLVTAAQSMHEAATAHEAALKQTGLPDDFLSQLDRAMKALVESVGTRAASKGRRAGATKALKVQDTRGRGVLKILDAVLIPLIGLDDDLLGQWNTARRIPVKPGPVTGKGSDVASTPIIESAPEEPKAA